MSTNTQELYVQSGHGEIGATPTQVAAIEEHSFLDDRWIDDQASYIGHIAEAAKDVPDLDEAPAATASDEASKPAARVRTHSAKGLPLSHYMKPRAEKPASRVGNRSHTSLFPPRLADKVLDVLVGPVRGTTNMDRLAVDVSRREATKELPSGPRRKR